MTNESNSGPKGKEEDDPLSATAMFFRTLDQQAGGKPEEPAAKFDFGAPAPASGGQDAAPGRPQSGSEKGEFTAIFGSGTPAAGPATPWSPPQPAPSEVFPPAWSEQDPVAKQGQSEFTRIFVKGASASPKPAGRVIEPAPEAAPPRGKGFSSPGVSDAASGHTSFSQFFKPVANVETTPVQPVQPASAAPFRPGTPRPSSTPDPFRSESPFDIPPNKPNASGQDPQSITSLIQSLSSEASARVPDPAPYRSESHAPFQPVVKPSAPPEFESGGVTQFIQRLAEMPPAPVVETPAAPPIREQNPGPGEYTRIISAPTRSVESNPSASAPSPAIAPAAAPPTPAFKRPAVPAMPVVPATPPARPVAPHPAPLPAMQPPGLPAPHLPPAPAPAAVAPPKGKLEALVPMLLVVNTFLLVVILVVMVFLIRSR